MVGRATGLPAARCGRAGTAARRHSLPPLRCASSRAARERSSSVVQHTSVPSRCINISTTCGGKGGEGGPVKAGSGLSRGGPCRPGLAAAQQAGPSRVPLCRPPRRTLLDTSKGPTKHSR
jgi:hypothetical protein